MSKMADEKLCRSDNSLCGLGVKVKGITWFPEGIVLIERELPKSLFITTRQKKTKEVWRSFVQIPRCPGTFSSLFSNTGTSFL